MTDAGGGNLMSRDLTTTQKMGVILIVTGVFIFLSIGLVPDVQADSPYSDTPFSCGSAATVFLTNTNPGVASECNEAAAEHLVRASVGGGFFALIGTCLIVLFAKPNGSRS